MNVKNILKSSDDFDKEDYKKATSYLISWLWSYKEGLLQPMPYGVMSDPEIELWSKNLHSLVLTQNLPPHPASLSVPSPSDATLSHLASNVHSLTTTLEKHHLEKSTKKCKFDSMESFTKQMILNASAKTSNISASRPCTSFLEILNCASASRSQASLNHKLHQKDCEVEVPLTLASFIVSVD